MTEAGPATWPVLYDLEGPERAPVLVLVGSLGTTRAVWDNQLRALGAWFRVLRVEHPGHGGAEAPKGPYTLAGLGGSLVRLLDALGFGEVSLAGLSLGGLVAMWLAVEQPERVRRLAVCCAAPSFGPPEMWAERAQTVRAEGTGPLVEAALGRWFTASFLRAHPEVASQYSAMLSGIDAEGYASCCEAIATADMRAQLGRIKAPTLVLAAAHDPVVPPESAAATMKEIPQASLCVLSGGAHLANVESPGPFNDALVRHLVGSPEERGNAERRAVLGGAHVDRALASASEVTAPFQELLTRWPWGDIWARPGLDRTTRRLVAIAMLVALGHGAELELHIRAALRDGLSPGVLREVLLQTAVYAGVPAANSAFAIAEGVLAKLSQGPGAQPL